MEEGRSKKTEVLRFRIPAAMKEALEREADEKDWTVSEVIRVALLGHIMVQSAPDELRRRYDELVHEITDPAPKREIRILYMDAGEFETIAHTRPEFIKWAESQGIWVLPDTLPEWGRDHVTEIQIYKEIIDRDLGELLIEE